MEVIYKTFDGRTFSTEEEALEYEARTKLSTLEKQRVNLVNECLLLKRSIFPFIEKAIKDIDRFAVLDNYFVKLHFPGREDIYKPLCELKTSLQELRIGKGDTRAALKIALKITRAKYLVQFKSLKKAIVEVSDKIKELKDSK